MWLLLGNLFKTYIGMEFVKAAVSFLNMHVHSFRLLPFSRLFVLRWANYFASGK